MSGKFMKIKRLIIPTLTMVIIASQLMGCSAMTQNELADMLKKGEQIEIDVYAPEHVQEEQGEQSPLIWEQLALLETNPTLRKGWEDTLGIIGSQENKNGILYINEDGEQDANNTLRVALHNTEFQKILSASASDKILSGLANVAADNYTDLEIVDSNNRNEILKAVYMGINSYFNLLPDSIPSYCNADSTITRAEFMAMVYRADTPVHELSPNSTFNNLVGQSEYNPYVQEIAIAGNSYLDIEYKGINPQTYNSNITRAEVIYTLVSRYFGDELQSLDLKDTNSQVAFSDCVNAGNIAADQKIVKDATTKDYWKSYELAFALQNADQGMPEEIYRAMVVAYQNNIITTETRWDEAATLSESLELLIKALLNEKNTSVYTAKLGTVNGYEVKDSGNEDSGLELDDNTTFEGNGNGVDVLIPDDFPYVDREAGQEEVVETPTPEIVEQPKVEQPKQEVQQPVQTSTPVNPMPTRTDGSDRTNSATGTGEGAGVGTFE